MFRQKKIWLRIVAAVVISLYLFVLCGQVSADEAEETSSEDFFEMSIEELVEVDIDEVYGASKYVQKIREAPSSVTIITAEEIKMYGYRTLADVLRSARGIYTTYDRNYTYLGVRGFGRPGDYNSRILVLLDGYRINDNVFDMGYIDENFPLDVDLIDRVEIIRGPGSSLYGSSAFFAVVNVFSKSGHDFDGWELSGEMASYDTLKGRSTYGKKFENGLETLLSYTSYDSDGQKLFFKEFSGTDNGIAKDADGQTYQNVFSKISYGDFIFTTAYITRKKLIPTAPWGTIFNNNETFTRERIGFFDLKYRHDYDWAEMMARMFYGFTRYDGEYMYDDGGVYVNEDYSHGSWYGGELQFTKELSDEHKLVWGTEYQVDRKQDQGTHDIWGTYLTDQRESERWGVYVQDEYKVFDDVTLNAGIRYDHYSTFGNTTNPRLGVIYDYSEKTTWKLLYGTAFRAPTAYELYYTDGSTAYANPDLQPETIDTFEVVMEHLLAKNIMGSVSAFQYNIHDLITFDDTALQFRNSEKVKAHGLEFEVDGKFENGWRGRVSYAFVETEDTETDRSLTNSSRHLGKANLIVPLIAEKLFAGFEAQYESKRKTLGGNQTDDFIVANLTLTYVNLAKNTDLSVGIYNLFDEKYGNPGFSEHTQDVINQDGRNLRVKLTYRF